MPGWLAVMGGRETTLEHNTNKQTSPSYLVTPSQPSALLHQVNWLLESPLWPVPPDRTIPPKMKAVSVQWAAGHQFCNDLLRAALLSLPVRENEINGI